MALIVREAILQINFNGIEPNVILIMFFKIPVIQTFKTSYVSGYSAYAGIIFVFIHFKHIKVAKQHSWGITLS